MAGRNTRSQYAMPIYKHQQDHTVMFRADVAHRVTDIASPTNKISPQMTQGLNGACWILTDV